MNDEHRPADSEGLEIPLQIAVNAALAPPIPDDAVERVKTKAKRLAFDGARPSPATRPSKRVLNTSRFILAGLAATAAVLVLVAGSLVWLDHSGSRAFAAMVDKVKAANTVRFAMFMQFGFGPEIKGAMYLEDDHLRQEQFDGKLVEVADLGQKKAMFLDMPGKIAQSLVVDAKLAGQFANPIDQLRHARSGEAVKIGEEFLDNHLTRVYRLPKVDLLAIKGNGEMLVWIDSESGLPAKIVIRDTDPRNPSEFRFEGFVWNEPLSPELFSLQIPAGFRAGKVVSTPHEELARSVEPKPETSIVPGKGIVIHDRVPGHIVWTSRGATVTAILRDPESVAPERTRSNELRQWDAATGKLLWSQSVQGADWVAATADGKLLAIVIGFEVQLRDAASGKIVRKWATGQPLSPLAFSPDGKTLAAGITEWGPHGGKGGKMSGGAEFWDVERAGLLGSITDDKPTTFVRYSGDGKYLATCSNDGPVKVWDAATKEFKCIVPGLQCAAFSPDGQTIAAPIRVSLEKKDIGRVGLFKLADGSPLKSLTAEKGASPSYLLSLAFSPDGRLLAAADWNGNVTLWDVLRGECKMTIDDFKGGVLDVAFAPDGATLAIGNEDQTLRLEKLPADMIPPKPTQK